MKNHFTIAGRGSLLSIAQVEIFKRKVFEKFPGIQLRFIIKTTKGDTNQTQPLHLVEGQDFFTREIQDSLLNGEADFAIHSLKDVSSDQFFNKSHIAIFDKEIQHDIVIFNEYILEKIKTNQLISIGTCSPRRTFLSVKFLEKALPNFNHSKLKIQATDIRGNVDTRLNKLSNGEYDGIVLAFAGIERLLKSESSEKKIRVLLKGKKIMVLPLTECPPAPGQGALVAETTITNQDAIKILQSINNEEWYQSTKAERKFSHQYGQGCNQQFGVVHLKKDGFEYSFATGLDNKGSEFYKDDFKPDLNLNDKIVFSAADRMNSFFIKRFYTVTEIEDNIETVFIASQHAIHSESIKEKVGNKRVWAAGTKTWFELAKKGIWVEGCTDGFGLESIPDILGSSLINIQKNEILILTNSSSIDHWQSDGWRVISTYYLIPDLQEDLVDEIQKADIIFWTSFQQYLLVRNYLKPGVQHCCPAGKTAVLFSQYGIQPVIFPGIKAFNQWKLKDTIAPVEG
jgi:hydroxymethylbilane synthase